MVKRIPLMLGIVAALAAFSSSAAVARERTPDGSFLRYRANTVSELKAEIASDRVAQARYAAYFGMSTKELLGAINNGVRLVTLVAPAKAEVWYVARGGRVASKPKLLPKGTQVFVARDGQVLLAWSCGNPIRAAITNLITPAKPPIDKNVTEKTLRFPVEEVSSLVIAAPPGLVTETTPALAIAEPALAVPTIAAAAAPTIAGLVPAAASSGGGLYNLGWLAGLAALTSRRDTPTVPEPGTLMALAAGLGSVAAVGGRRFLKRSK